MDVKSAAGSLGPRLAGRLTAELIYRSPQYMNCIKYYEIDLRGNKVSAIENLGATENQFDSIDLSDNAIVRVEGFPKLHRLKVLLLNNNRVARIARGLQESVPNIEMLILTNNKIANLKDIDPLMALTKLRYLSLIGNPVAAHRDYRLYVISRLPRLKMLDFKKVRRKEQEEAKQRFGEPTAAAQAQAREQTVEPAAAAAAKGAAKTFDPDQQLAAAVGAATAAGSDGAKDGETAATQPTPEQILALKAAIANAQTLEEMQSLEEALRAGKMPSQLKVAANGDAMDEG